MPTKLRLLESSLAAKRSVLLQADPGGGPRLTGALSCGGSVELDELGERLVVRGVDGDVQLRMHSTPEGLVLSFGAAHLEVAQTRSLKLAVGRLCVEAREGIELASEGPITQRIRGDISTHCDGEVRVDAGAVRVTAHTGELELDSTHDLSVRGERVLINC